MIRILILSAIWNVLLQQHRLVNSFASSSFSRKLYPGRTTFVISSLSSVTITTPLIPSVHHQRHQPLPTTLLFSSFTSDGSEYAAGDSDFDTEDDFDDTAAALLRNNNGDNELEEDDDDENRFVPTIELQPVPLSKNAGNRFITIVWDRMIKNRERFPLQHTEDDMKAWHDHNDRVRYTEDHVMFCRKQNLYNATFNNHSMVDILWSLPM